MKEDLQKALIDIKSLFRVKNKLFEKDLQTIFNKYKLSIKEINYIYKLLEEINVEPIVDEEIDKNNIEPTDKDIEQINNSDTIEEDEVFSQVKEVFLKCDILNEDNYIDIANIIKRCNNNSEILLRIKKYFDNNNIQIDLNDYKIEKLYEKENNIEAMDKGSYTSDPIRAYLKEIGKIDLLTPKKEKELAKKIFDLHNILVNLDKTDPEYEIINEEYHNVKKYFAEHNLRLVVSIAKKYIGRGLDFLDLIQEGNLGLEKAIEKFDYRRGFKFSTYATWWIRQSVARAVDDQSTTIRIPVHLREKMNKLSRIEKELEVSIARKPTNYELMEVFFPNIEKELEERLGRKPTNGEIEQEKNNSIEEIQYLKKLLREYDLVSLDTPIRNQEDDDSVILDFIADENSVEMEENVYNIGLRNNLKEVLDELSIKERITLITRFGLYEGIISDEEKEALATKIVIKKLPKEIREQISEMNSKLNEANDIQPILLTKDNITRHKDYLQKQNLITNYYKQKDPNYITNKNKEDYNKNIKVIANYNVMSGVTASNKVSTIRNNLNLYTYLYLKEHYKSYYEFAYRNLTHGNNRTLEDVGDIFGVTRERIRQIEAKGLKKLRHPARGKLLRDYL